MKTLATLLMILGQAEPAQAAASPQTPLTLGGITIGQSEPSVVARLGKPKKRTKVPDVFLPVTLSYLGIVVSLDEQGVGGVLSTSREFCTPAGICPGMTYERVTAVYGKSDLYERDGHFFRDYLWDDGCWLRIRFESDITISVETTCSP